MGSRTRNFANNILNAKFDGTKLTGDMLMLQSLMIIKLSMTYLH